MRPVRSEPVGGAAAGEGVEAQAGELRRQAQRAFEPARAGLVRGDLLGAGGVAGRGQGDGDGSPVRRGRSPAIGGPSRWRCPRRRCSSPSGARRCRAAWPPTGLPGRPRIIEWPVPQRGAEAPRLPTGKKARTPTFTATAVTASSAAVSAIRRMLQRCSTIGGRCGGEGTEFAEQVTRVPLHERAQLGRAGHPAGGGEGLRQLVRCEVAQRPAVDAFPGRCAPRGPASCCPGRPPAATVMGAPGRRPRRSAAAPRSGPSGCPA